MSGEYELVSTTVYKGRTVEIRRVEFVNQDGEDEDYYYWENLGGVSPCKCSFMPVHSEEAALGDFKYTVDAIEDGSFWLSEEDIQNAVVKQEAALGIGQTKH